MSRFSGLPRRAGLILGMTGLLLGPTTAIAQTQTDNADTVPGPHPADTYTAEPDVPEAQHEDPHPLLHDIGAYYTSPLRWDVKDWAYFGGGLALVAASHHYDSQVRTHFISQGTKPLGG